MARGRQGVQPTSQVAAVAEAVVVAEAAEAEARPLAQVR